MSNDFRSLLSTFQAATTTGQTPSSIMPSTSLLEATTQQWRLSQLQMSMKTTLTTTERDSSTTTTTHLAICLCIVDDLPHEEIWKYWIKDNGFTAELYLHAKHPERIKSDWARSKLISISHNPNWNDVRIVKAMLSLAREALKEERTGHLYFGTESCLPICGLSEVSLLHSKSYLSYYGKEQASRFEERECWSPVEVFVPSDAICKALPGWCVLCRHHVEAVLNVNDRLGDNNLELWQAFEHCWAPEEVYFATALNLLGLLTDEHVVRRSLVHAEWNERARNREDRAHPREYDDDFGEGLVRHLRGQQFVFLRKVKHRMLLERWKKAVLLLGNGGGRGASQSDHGERRPSLDDHHHREDWRRRRPTPQDGHYYYNEADRRSEERPDRHHHHRGKRKASQDAHYGDRRHYEREDYYERHHRRRREDNHDGRGERSQYRHGR